MEERWGGEDLGKVDEGVEKIRRGDCLCGKEGKKGV